MVRGREEEGDADSLTLGVGPDGAELDRLVRGRVPRTEPGGAPILGEVPAPADLSGEIPRHLDHLVPAEQAGIAITHDAPQGAAPSALRDRGVRVRGPRPGPPAGPRGSARPARRGAGRFSARAG